MIGPHPLRPDQLAPRVLSFVVEGVPVPKGRPRVMAGYAFTPRRTKDYEALVRATAQEAVMGLPGWRLDAEHYEVRVAVYRAAKRGDLDNYVKSITDALNHGVAYHDDKHVRRIVAEMHDDKAHPRVHVEVEHA
jgi:Holliday junction resolvase RusA-like endonuclease